MIATTPPAFPATSLLLFLPLVGVILGVALTAGVAWLKDMLRRKRLIRALYVELKDDLAWLQRGKLTAELMIQEAACNKMADFIPPQPPTHIYENHIAELAFYLRESERISFNAIHNLLALVQKQHAGLADKRVQFRQGDVAAFNEYVQLLHASYSNLVLLVCHVAHHVEFRRRVNVRDVTGEDARSVDITTQQRLQRLILEAQTIGLTAVKEKYYRGLDPVGSGSSKTVTGAQLLGAADSTRASVMLCLPQKETSRSWSRRMRGKVRANKHNDCID